MKKIKSTFINMVVVMSIVAGFSAILVSYIYQLTLPAVQRNALAAEVSAISEIFGTDFDNNPIEEKTIIPTKNSPKEINVYPLRKGDTIYALAVKSYTNKGFGGELEIMTGFYIDGTMAGYKVLNHKETPGLGSKIMENKFISQFIGIKFDGKKLKLKKDGGQIDGITSATISSKALLDAVNNAKKAYDRFSLKEIQ